MFDYEFISYEIDKYDKEDMILSYKEIPCWLMRRFGHRERIVKFVGSCTVWHSYPDFHRQDTMMEVMLSACWERIVWKRKRGMV